MHKAAIIEASGFTGAELLRICASHPDLEAVVATGESMAGQAVADLPPSLAPASRRDLTGAARRSYVRSCLREMDHEAARHRSVAPVAVAAKQAEKDYHSAFSVD